MANSIGISSKLVDDGGVSVNQRLSDHDASILANVLRLNQHDLDLSNLNDTLTAMENSMHDVATNVLDYGATGTGSNGDTAAIQSVLNLAKTNGGVHVVIPDGTYWITSRLYIYRNTKITLGKNAIMLRKWAGGWMANIDLVETYTGYNGNGNIIIDGGIWDGNWATYGNKNPDGSLKTPQPTHYAMDGFGLVRGENMIFRNMTILDVMGAHAFDVNACKNLLFDKIVFKGYHTDYSAWGDNVSYFREAIQISELFAAGYSVPAGDSYDGTPCQNVTVRNCYFGASANLPAYPTGVGNHGSVANQYNSNIRVYDNTFEGQSYAGVRPFKYKDVFIYGNYFLNCNEGVHISAVGYGTSSSVDANGTQTNQSQAGSNHIIAQNIFKETTANGVYAAGQTDTTLSAPARIDGITIAYNIFDADGVTTGNGCNLQLTKNVKAYSNIFKGMSETFYVAYPMGISIYGNTAENTIAEFLYTNEPDTTWRGLGLSKKIFVYDNRIYNCGRTGIFIQYQNTFDVYNNYIENPSTETDLARNGITISSTSQNGRAYGNTVRKPTSGNGNAYGIQVTNTCNNVQTYNNDVEGKTGRSQNLSTGGFEGMYLHSADGTRYKVSVANGGTISITAG